MCLITAAWVTRPEFRSHKGWSQAGPQLTSSFLYKIFCISSKRRRFSMPWDTMLGRFDRRHLSFTENVLFFLYFGFFQICIEHVKGFLYCKMSRRWDEIYVFCENVSSSMKNVPFSENLKVYPDFLLLWKCVIICPNGKRFCPGKKRNSKENMRTKRS